MKFGKRLFLTSTVAYPAVIMVACGKGSGSNPTAPTAPPQTPGPNPAQACWGVRIGEVKFAEKEGTLKEVMDAAKLPYQIRGGLITSFNGETPSAGIIFLVKGEYFRVPVENIRLTAGDSYAAYKFSGTHPNSQGSCS